MEWETGRVGEWCCVFGIGYWVFGVRKELGSIPVLIMAKQDSLL